MPYGLSCERQCKANFTTTNYFYFILYKCDSIKGSYLGLQLMC